jgi:hypothetical protein
MVTPKDYPPNWVILPGSSVTAKLVTPKWTNKPVIEIRGNRPGIFSLGILLLWITTDPSATESLSITGLPFVRAQSTLCLIVVQTWKSSDSYGQLIRTDKDKQFQWLISPELLQRAAISLLSIAFTPPDLCGDHMHGDLAPDCEYELFFVRDDDA